MDQDGANHRFLTNGQSTVLTPRFSPDSQWLTYMSYDGERPQVWLYDMAAGRQRLLVSQPNMTFAPRFSPDSRHVVFSMAVNGNTDIYRVPVGGGTPQRLTNAPGIDTGGSYSPDGSRIVFESDRGGSQQLYVMNADGSDQRRISFGGGQYGTPVWSPRGDMIAYTKIGPGFPHRRDERGRRRRAHADGGLAGRGPELGAERPRHQLLQDRAGLRPDRALVGRSNRRQREEAADAARRLRSVLVAAAQLILPLGC
jgi:Tol biopolymer transport system component